LWATALLLIFGSQSLLGQEFLINMFNPGLVAAIAYLGLAIWNNNYFGMLIAVFIVVASFSLVYWFVHHLLQRRSLAKDWLLKRGLRGTQKTLGGVVPIMASTDAALHNPDSMDHIEHDLYRRVTVHQQANWHIGDLNEVDRDLLDLEIDDDEVYSAKDTDGGSDDERRSGSELELDIDFHSNPDGLQDLAAASNDGDYAEEDENDNDNESEHSAAHSYADDDCDEIEDSHSIDLQANMRDALE
jgi:type IV secretory pathway TrbD component